MATGITFWQLPEEEPRLLRYIDGTGDILAHEWDLISDPALFRPRPLLTVIEEDDPDDIAIAPREFMEPIIPNPVESDGRTMYAFSYLRFPLIVYNRPRFRSARTLLQSSMCAEWWDSKPEHTELVRKPEAFIEWAQRVFRWVRRFTPQKQEYYRLTEQVAAAAKARRIKLMPGWGTPGRSG